MTNETQKVKIESIICDDGIYPRQQVSWPKVYEYQKAMEAGCVFPAIKLGCYKNKFYLIDGWHRVNAYKNRGVAEVDAIVQDYSSRIDMLDDATDIAMRGSLPLNMGDKTKVFNLFKQSGKSDSEISLRLGVPVNNFNVFIDRFITKSGKTVIIPKMITEQLRDKRFSEDYVEKSIDVKEANKLLISRNADHAINQVIFMFQNNLVPIEQESTKKLCIQLYDLLAEKALMA